MTIFIKKFTKIMLKFIKNINTKFSHYDLDSKLVIELKKKKKNQNNIN